MSSILIPKLRFRIRITWMEEISEYEGFTPWWDNLAQTQIIQVELVLAEPKF